MFGIVYNFDEFMWRIWWKIEGNWNTTQKVSNTFMDLSYLGNCLT
jgi:hypothetical protein